MNRSDVVKLLTLAAAFDQRTVGETDVDVWHLVLNPLDYRDAERAMVRHYRTSPDVRLKPGHLYLACASRTDGDAAGRAVSTACQDGTLCGTCQGVHHAQESCSVLVARPWPRAIESVGRRPEMTTGDEEAKP